MNPETFLPTIETALFGLLLVFILVFVYFGFTFNYHWNQYSFDLQFKRIVEGTYFFVSVLLLLTLLFFIGLYMFGYGF